MAQFSYQAIDRSGQSVAGTIESSNDRSAAAILSQQGRFVVHITPSRVSETDAAATQSVQTAQQGAKQKLKLKLPLQRRATLMRHLADALAAEVPLMRALELLKNQSSHGRTVQTLEIVSDAIGRGCSPSQTFGQLPANIRCAAPVHDGAWGNTPANWPPVLNNWP